jgi:hypothetical protein
MTKERLVVITGAAKGADRVADEWCWTRLDDLADHAQFPADWDRHGKRAGYIRNREMLDEGKPDFVIAFRCDGESNGTDMMVELARKAGLPVYVVSGGREPDFPSDGRDCPFNARCVGDKEARK